jgi:hypothetical protein
MFRDPFAASANHATVSPEGEAKPVELLLNFREETSFGERSEASPNSLEQAELSKNYLDSQNENPNLLSDMC